MSRSLATPSVARLPKMIMTAVLAALQIVMTLTGLAYIPIGPLKLTILTLPVAVGAVLLGPTSGFALGTVFGLTSFFTCFGMDPFGAVLLGIQPVYLFIMCVVPRILCGWLPALLYRGLKNSALGRRDRSDLCAMSVACLSTPLINTVLFLSSMWLFFADSLIHNEKLIEQLGGTVISSLVSLFVVFAGTNALIEAATTLVLGTAVCKALTTVLRRQR